METETLTSQEKEKVASVKRKIQTDFVSGRKDGQLTARGGTPSLCTIMDGFKHKSKKVTDD